MPKTWANYECSFCTLNTTNNAGNTRYLVTANKMFRCAAINLTRGEMVQAAEATDLGLSLGALRKGYWDQVLTGNPSICYMTPGSRIQRAILEQDDDNKITVVRVSGDVIWIKVLDALGKDSVVGDCARVPQNGLEVLDFVNNNGALSDIHPGHEVTQLTLACTPHGFYDRVVFHFKNLDRLHENGSGRLT